MRIFKFGGASVKDAENIKNLVHVLQHEGVNNTMIVVSAMGKMTNAFEEVVFAYCNKKELLTEKIAVVKKFHQQIADVLFNKNHVIFNKIEEQFKELTHFINNNNNNNYNFIYDQIVSAGELLATSIISAFLNENNIENTWLDVRTIIKTDSSYRKATVNWQLTQDCCKTLNTKDTLYITQGFIAADEKNNTTTLGREGSDYTAAILAYCLHADSTTIWKDVNGVLNADPRIFKKTELLRQISYQEAVEMAFYGASVMHPKTLKPLENKKIPLYVRSFNNLQNPGTKVGKGIAINPKTPCFIVKKNQILVSIAAHDFSFMVEQNLSIVFKLLHKYQLKITLIQNSAISFSVCLEDNFNHFQAFYKELQPAFVVKYNSNVTLYTIRHFTEKAAQQIEQQGTLLVKQSSRETLQLVLQANKKEL